MPLKEAMYKQDMTVPSYPRVPLTKQMIKRLGVPLSVPHLKQWVQASVKSHVSLLEVDKGTSQAQPVSRCFLGGLAKPRFRRSTPWVRFSSPFLISLCPVRPSLYFLCMGDRKKREMLKKFHSVIMGIPG